MARRRPLVAGNWKMNGTRAEAGVLVDAILHGMPAAVRYEVAVCPPFILIPLVAERLAPMAAVVWGAQDLDIRASGAYTGAVSGPMLWDYGCTYVIVGHSERRTLYGEADTTVAAKFGAAQSAGLTPILCIGETLEEREAGVTESVVKRQLDTVLNAHGVKSFERAVIAYEPVWAIGTGRTATPEQAQEVHRFIRHRLASADDSIAEKMRILYGGSVKGDSAKTLFQQQDIDGGLIGGASLKADEFLSICQAAEVSLED